MDVLRRNNVTIAGRGTRPMLFAHGFGCDQNMWRFVAPAFAEDHQLILFDYVGCGRSDLSAYDERRYSSLDGYAQDVLEVCEALDLRDAIFVGHSVSCMIGLLAARRAPRHFAKMVLVGPSPHYLNDGDYTGGFDRADLEGLLVLMDKNFIGWASMLAPVVMKNPERPELVQELEQSFCSTDPRIARRFAEVTFFGDNRHDLDGSAPPSLILQCSDDAIAPRSVGEFVHRAMPGSILRILDATGHCPHMSHPDETIAAIREYLGG